MNTPRGVWLDDLTSQETTARFDGDAVVVLPVAAAGASITDAAHLPLKTAATIARALGQRLVDRLAVVVAPVVDADSFSQHETLRQVLLECLDKFRSRGVRRFAILDAGLDASLGASLSHAPPLDVSADVLMLRVCNRSDADEYATSCLLALDPRSVRMALLPAGSRAQAFAGERMMAGDVAAAVTALVAKWPDLE